MKQLSFRSKRAVWTGTIAGTAFCVIAAFLVDFPTFAGMAPDQLRRELIVHTWVPIALAGPLLFLLLTKIRALALAHDEMEKLATTDALTGVLNRGAFTMMVEAYLERVVSHTPNGSGTLLVLDVDHFKSINDRFGHVSGDEALKQISVAVQLAMRPTDLVGRIGGEEFAILLPATTSSQASLVAERIRQRVSAIEFPDGGQRLLSVSIGGVHFQKESSFERLFRIADRCLYLAKEHGRNRVNMIEHIGAA